MGQLICILSDKAKEKYFCGNLTLIETDAETDAEQNYNGFEDSIPWVSNLFLTDIETFDTLVQFSVSGLIGVLPRVLKQNSVSISDTQLSLNGIGAKILQHVVLF